VTTSFRLRVLTPDDWRLWRTLRLLALEESPEAFGATLAEWTGPGDTEDRWRGRLTNVPYTVVAVDDLTGDPIGEASGMHVDDAPGQAELISMYVHPGARGNGVAAALIDDIAAWAAANGATELVLSVKRTNDRARRTYLRHGFEDHGEPGDEPDEHRLTKPLS
jgi:GNAT superfamily N-acetyltransferase